jgi:serine/threonine-protein kinase
MQCEACGHANLEGARFCANCGALLASEQKGPDPMIGQLVGGRFRITGVLGEGGMGVVYAGEQQMGSSVRKVAVKTLHPHLSKDPSVIARFHRECGTVAELEHPNTIKVYDFGTTTEGTLYIAMEFVSGRALADIIRDERQIAPERVINILRQVCGALDEAHQKGIIHRDLKPENLILASRAGESDFVKVLDFGIAARSESADAQKEQKLTQQGMVLGTPPYMSPEQFTGKALDRRSDIYSLGVMTYEMLTGRLPFDADTPWQWATQHMTAQPIPFETAAPSRHLPGPLRQAIMKSLAKNREERQSSAREFFTELSDGGRVTVDAAAPVATGTAAMDRMPDFGAPVATGVAGQTIVGPVGGGMAPGPVGALPAPPAARRGGGGGGKGLLLGLGALGVVLLAAMAVVAARSMKTEEEPVLTSPFQPGSAGSVTTIAPLDVSAPAPTAAIPPLVTEPTRPATTTPTTPRTGQPKTPSTGAGGSVAGAGTPTTPTTTPTTPTPTTPKPPSGGGACDSCAALVSAGSWRAAAAAYQSCEGDAKTACSRSIRRSAREAAKAAAFNGDCGTAGAIIAAATAAGQSASSMQDALKGTSCAK